MHLRRRLWLLVSVMAVVAGGVALTSLWLSYETVLDLERDRLTQVVQSQAGVLAAVARFDQEHSQDFPEGPEAATLAQFREGSVDLHGMGDSGEFTLARREGDWIRFLFRQRTDTRLAPDSIQWSGELAEPQRRALAGEAGTMVGLDYAGNEVLAAYRPVGTYGWGLVAKMHMAEVRAPFIRAAGLLLLVAAALIILGVLLHRRIGEPFIEELALSEERYRLIAENTADGIWTMDQDLRFTYVNPAVEAMLGYSTEEWIGSHLSDHCPPEDFLRARQAFSEMTAGPMEGRSFRADLRLIRKDGTELPVEVNGRSLVMPDGQIQIQGVTRNMEERVERERAVREKAEEFETLFRASPLGMVQLDAEGMVVRWNPAATRIFGWTEEEVVGQPVPFERPGRGEGVGGFTGEALEGEPVTVGDFAARKKDGSVLEVNLNAAPIRGADGAIVGAMASVEDTSEKRRVEREAMEVQQRLEGFFYFSPALQHIKDLEGRHVEVNRRFEEVTGVSRDEALGKTNEEIFPPEVARHLSASDARVRETGEPLSEEEEIHWMGERRAFLTTKFPMFGADMDVVGLGSVAIDVTAKRRVQEALARSEAGFRSVVDNAPYGISRMDATGRMLSANPALRSMLGYDTSAELLDPEVQQRIFVASDQPEALIGKILDSKGVAGEDLKLRRRDGTEIMVRIRGRRVDDPTLSPEDGDEAGPFVEIMAEDISERRRLEEQLRHAQKMEAVGQLTGGIAHDFNNELSVILLNAEMARQDLEEGRDITPEDLDHIHGAAQRASNITRQLLGFSRKAELRMESTDLAAVIRSLGKLLHRVVREDIQLQVEADDVVASTMVDPRAVEQMILNLTANAQDAMPDGGTLTLEVRERELDAEFCETRPDLEPGRFVMVLVRDTGFGMDEETRARVFEPFFTTKEVGSGTGLGMAMVFGLTTQQGGYVNLYSEPGEGTEVHLYFPVADEVSPRAAEERPKGARTGGEETILVVEDEHAVRTAAKRALEKAGYRVLTAVNGKEAMGLYRDRSGEIDLVLSDLVMPEVGGLALYEWIRTVSPETKFLLVSGYTGRRTDGGGGVDPSIPFVGKPWTLNELLGRVREVLDQG